MNNTQTLAFYQPRFAARPGQISASHIGGISAVALANVSHATAGITNGLNSQIALFRGQITEYNTQLNGYLTSLGNERVALSGKLSERLAQNPLYDGMRSDGVSLAWDYEAADIKMGGSGSASWTPEQQQEILNNRPEIVNKTKWIDGKPQHPGGVRGQEGHHINNVAGHEEQQVNPDNIEFMDSDAHKEAHGGNWQNPTEGDLINKDDMLKDTNARRVKAKTEDIVLSKKSIFKNELRGLGTAVAIGLGVGAAIGFVVTLAQAGVSAESLQLAVIEGAKGGVEAGALSAVGYGVGRTIGEISTKSVVGTLESLGVSITENITKMVGMGVVGSLTIVVFSAYQFFKLRRQGVDAFDVLRQVGKQALFSMLLLSVSIIAQGAIGGPAGLIVSVSFGLIFISYAIGKSIHQRRFEEKLRGYTIENSRPVFVC
jgi:hypothetical protein